MAKQWANWDHLMKTGEVEKDPAEEALLKSITDSLSPVARIKLQPTAKDIEQLLTAQGCVPDSMKEEMLKKDEADYQNRFNNWFNSVNKPVGKDVRTETAWASGKSFLSTLSEEDKAKWLEESFKATKGE